MLVDLVRAVALVKHLPFQSQQLKHENRCQIGLNLTITTSE